MEKKKRKRRRRSTLTLYLDRVADGDENYRSKLCKNLVDRLLHIPLDTSDDAYNESKGAGVKIKVMRQKYAGKVVVPVFTDENMFKTWKAEQKKDLDTVALMGGDLCKVLPDGLWLLVDWGADSEVLLDEAAVKSIATFGDEALAAEFGGDEVIELKETDIIELNVPLGEVSESLNGQASSGESGEEPKGLRGWLGI